jgi:hypothetical protein
MSETVPTKAAAEACETTPRLLRQFLRASTDYQAVGSGGRYAFEADDLPLLKTRFTAWVAEREAAAQARAEAEKAAAPAEELDAGDNGSDDTDDEAEPEPVKAKPAPRGRKVAA